MSKPTKKPQKEIKEKRPVGRLPFYPDPEEMQKKIDEYFDYCDAGEEIEVYSKKQQEVVKMVQKIPYTVPGLSHYLGFASRQSFQDYEKKGKRDNATKKDKLFSFTIARARQRIEQQRNEGALMGRQEPRFSQFDLKENFGWKDQQDLNVEQSVVHGVSAELSTLISDIVGEK